MAVPTRGGAITHGSAGWPDNNYWTGQVNNGGNNAIIVNDDGNDNPDNVNNDNPVVCLR